MLSYLVRLLVIWCNYIVDLFEKKLFKARNIIFFKSNFRLCVSVYIAKSVCFSPP